MDKDERQHHAREMLRNPLFGEFMARIEADAINAALAADLADHSAHQAQIAMVRAVRTFRQHFEAELRNTPSPKAAPA